MFLKEERRGREFVHTLSQSAALKCFHLTRHQNYCPKNWPEICSYHTYLTECWIHTNISVFSDRRLRVSPFQQYQCIVSFSVNVCVGVYFIYLILLDACQVPTEAQTDLTALPLLQEQHRFAHKTQDKVIC